MSVFNHSGLLDLLAGAVAQSGVSVSPEAIAGMARHFAIVLEANQTLNLTAITEPAEAAAKHYCDSLAVARVMDAMGIPERERGDSGENQPPYPPYQGGKKTAFPDFSCQGGRKAEFLRRAVDVGAGAGFPGIPLALARPDWRWTLIEAKRKKAEFLARVVEELELTNVEVCVGRSEDLARGAEFRDRFDLAAGRAIASLGVVAELLLPLVRPGGLAVAMKGPAETAPAPCDSAVARLGASAPEWMDYELPGGFGKRTLAVFRKIAPTAPEFPRRAGMAEKRPLF